VLVGACLAASLQVPNWLDQVARVWLVRLSLQAGANPAPISRPSPPNWRVRAKPPFSSATVCSLQSAVCFLFSAAQSTRTALGQCQCAPAFANSNSNSHGKRDSEREKAIVFGRCFDSQSQRQSAADQLELPKHTDSHTLELIPLESQ